MDLIKGLRVFDNILSVCKCKYSTFTFPSKTLQKKHVLFKNLYFKIPTNCFFATNVLKKVCLLECLSKEHEIFGDAHILLKP